MWNHDIGDYRGPYGMQLELGEKVCLRCGAAIYYIAIQRLRGSVVGNRFGPSRGLQAG